MQAPNPRLEIDADFFVDGIDTPENQRKIGSKVGQGNRPELAKGDTQMENLYDLCDKHVREAEDSIVCQKSLCWYARGFISAAWLSISISDVEKANLLTRLDKAANSGYRKRGETQ